MTNSSPPNPQPSEPPTITLTQEEMQQELRRARQQGRRRAGQEVTEEWIAVIVAFGVIGAILFWSFGGGKNNFKLLSENNFLSSSRQTTETKTNTNLELNSPELASINNIDNLNIAQSAGGTKSEKIITSGASSIDTITSDKFKQRNNSFSSLPPVASIPPVTTSIVPPTIPEEVIAETESEVVIIESESEGVTSETESEVVITESEVETSSGEETDLIALSDVSEDYWAYPFLEKLGEEKLLPDSTSFEPDAFITRAGMASFISHAFKDSLETEAPKQFKDVPAENNDLVTDINKAVAMGFMNGYSDETFIPEDNIPRYQVLVALATGLKLEPSGNADTILQNFTDRDELPEWSLDKVAAATEAGLVVNRTGFNPTSMNPNEPATRAEVAAMIYQSLSKSGEVTPIESPNIVSIP